MARHTGCPRLLFREQTLSSEVMTFAVADLPFPLLGFGSDNDSVFVNETISSWCEAAKFMFSRSRSCRKNGEAPVEQRLALASNVLEEGLALELDGRGPDALRLQDLACRYGQYYACFNAGRLCFEGRLVPRDVAGALERLRVACDRLPEAACRLRAEAVLSGADATQADRERSSVYLGQLCSQADARACHNLAVIRMSPAFGTPDPDAAMKLLARNCIERGFNASCEPYYAMYNSSLPQRSASSNAGMSILEEGVLAIMSVAADGLSALSTQHSALSTQHSALSTQHSALSPQRDWQLFIGRLWRLLRLLASINDDLQHLFACR
ncbi:MAG: hypothetical protein K9G83_04070 [Hyphomonadaceae bacterium]|nr:hypothetical protein [Hyphomonadaceae bacterium]